MKTLNVHALKENHTGSFMLAHILAQCGLPHLFWPTEQKWAAGAEFEANWSIILESLWAIFAGACFAWTGRNLLAMLMLIVLAIPGPNFWVESPWFAG